MEQPKQNSAANTLKYSKRRYDGGSEIELIRHIERQQTVAQLHRLQQKQRELEQSQAEFRAVTNTIEQPMDLQDASKPLYHNPNLETPNAASQAQVAEIHEAKRSRKISETLLLGPLEICVGAVGVLTSIIAIITFGRMKNEDLVKQSKGVLKDCVLTFGKGFVDTAKGPFRAAKIAVAG